MQLFATSGMADMGYVYLLFIAAAATAVGILAAAIWGATTLVKEKRDVPAWVMCLLAILIPLAAAWPVAVFVVCLVLMSMFLLGPIYALPLAVVGRIYHRIGPIAAAAGLLVMSSLALEPMRLLTGAPSSYVTEEEAEAEDDGEPLPPRPSSPIAAVWFAALAVTLEAAVEVLARRTPPIQFIHRSSARLLLVGDFGPDELEAKTGLQPSECLPKGEWVDRFQAARIVTRWRLDSGRADDAPLEDHLRGLLGRLDAVVDRKTLVEAIRLYHGRVELYARGADARSGLRLPSDLLAGLARYGLDATFSTRPARLGDVPFPEESTGGRSRNA